MPACSQLTVAADTDAVTLLEDVPLTDVEAGYVDAA